MSTTTATTAAPPQPDSDDRPERHRVLDAKALTKVFGKGRNAVRAVDDVDLVVHAGEVVALLGPNGAGKTTTIKMVAGLVTPSRGDVAILGEDVRRHRGRAVRQLGAVLEGGRNVYWAMSAWQNLIYFGRLRGLRTRDIAPHAEWLLRELGLWERRKQAVGSYSRGMQQKVAIAAALVSDPALLLLDEPTIGLDVNAARTVKAWIRRLATEEHKAVVLTTHQLGVAQELSDRVAVINEGRILADRPISQLLDQFREDRYEIHVAASAEDLAPSMLYEIRTDANGDDDTTLEVATTASSKTLYKVLEELAVQKVPLLSVAPVRPDLEDVFVRLVSSDR